MPSAIARIASGISRRSPNHLHDLADQHALHQREDHADERKHESDRRRGVAKPRLAEHRERRFKTRERQRHDEVQRQQKEQRRLGQRVAERVHPAEALGGSGGRSRFRQQEPRRHEVGEAQRRGKPHRRLRADAAQQPADRGTEDEARARTPRRPCPCPRARFSGVVTSAMYACAVGMLAPAMPPTMRATNTRASDVDECEREIRQARAHQADQDDRLAADRDPTSAPRPARTGTASARSWCRAGRS